MPNILDNPLYGPPRNPPRHFPYPNHLCVGEAAERDRLGARASRVGLTPTDRDRYRDLVLRSYRPAALR